MSALDQLRSIIGTGQEAPIASTMNFWLAEVEPGFDRSRWPGSRGRPRDDHGPANCFRRSEVDQQVGTSLRVGNAHTSHLSERKEQHPRPDPDSAARQPAPIPRRLLPVRSAGRSPLISHLPHAPRPRCTAARSGSAICVRVSPD